MYSVKYPIFMHYVTITSSCMYSIDICAVSQLLMMTQNNKIDCWNHSLVYLHSKVDYMCSVTIKYVLLNSIFDLLFHVYIIIRRICMRVALSKYNRLVLFLILFYEMEDVYKECAIILKNMCLTIPYVFRSNFS